MGGSEEDRVRCFSGVLSERRDHGQKLQRKEFHLNARKTFSVGRLPEHWARLSRQVVESPPLVIRRARLDTALSNQLYLTLP